MSRLAEDLVLLLLDDSSGRSTVDMNRRHRAVGSAVLLDLVRAGRIRIPVTPVGKEPRVDVLDTNRTGNPALDAALRRMGTKSMKVGWAADNLGQVCWKPLLELLAADGAIRLEEQRTFGVIKTKSWPAEDGARERTIRQAIAAALGGAQPDEETSVLITILHAIGAVPGAADDATRARAAEIARSGWASGPLREAFHGLDTAWLVTLYAG
ncbi:GOLPH3/VPS74 family protein [Micromonospora parathelypteridis]|uniref:GPP34 family phosphoprotein n=1 Tax=Micromonospora parathelypteridis TaxID=1839617 RepID=A0A840VVI4_9ACTN|nr:GPP34 family phosphoprotein [Micromonospora parathelypteridis]MBB5481333.1 hypothetical protein [Micromonospora parathelypteridis]GGO19013.1 hypothetical protein GCM10011576_34620 [Micromonospora parathelypteridis]